VVSADHEISHEVYMDSPVEFHPAPSVRRMLGFKATQRLPNFHVPTLELQDSIDGENTKYWLFAKRDDGVREGGFRTTVKFRKHTQLLAPGAASWENEANMVVEAALKAHQQSTGEPPLNYGCFPGRLGEG
jgi:hypothetical protein